LFFADITRAKNDDDDDQDNKGLLPRGEVSVKVGVA